MSARTPGLPRDCRGVPTAGRASALHCSVLVAEPTRALHGQRWERNAAAATPSPVQAAAALLRGFAAACFFSFFRSVVLLTETRVSVGHSGVFPWHWTPLPHACCLCGRHRDPRHADPCPCTLGFTQWRSHLTMHCSHAGPKTPRGLPGVRQPRCGSLGSHMAGTGAPCLRTRTR